MHVHDPPLRPCEASLFHRIRAVNPSVHPSVRPSASPFPSYHGSCSAVPTPTPIPQIALPSPSPQITLPTTQEVDSTALILAPSTANQNPQPTPEPIRHWVLQYSQDGELLDDPKPIADGFFSMGMAPKADIQPYIDDTNPGLYLLLRYALQVSKILQCDARESDTY